MYEVHPELKDVITGIRLFSYSFPTALSVPPVPFPPRPEQALYFYPRERVVCHHSDFIAPLPKSIIVGPHLSLVKLCMSDNVMVVYVGFRPGALYRLLGIPMIELLNYPLDSTLVFGSDVDDVIQRINEAKDNNSVMRAVESFLLSKAGKRRRLLPFDDALYYLSNLHELPAVDQWAHCASMSVRQLERHFRERMGMSPKLFIKLVRFSRAWNMREKNPDISWNKIAHACNYADHMHMIRDFKQFSGATPGELQRHLHSTPLRLQAELEDSCRV